MVDPTIRNPNRNRTNTNSNLNKTRTANSSSNSTPMKQQQSNSLIAKIKRNLPLFLTIVGVGVAAIIIIPTVVVVEANNNAQKEFKEKEITVQKIEYSETYTTFRTELSTNIDEINAALIQATGGVDEEGNPKYNVVPDWFIIHNGNDKLLAEVAEEQDLGNVITQVMPKIIIDEEKGTISIDFGIVWNSKLLVPQENKTQINLLGDIPILSSAFETTLLKLRGLGKIRSAEELQTFVNFSTNKTALVNKIVHNDKITVGDLTVAFDEQAQAYDVTVPYTVKPGQTVYGSSPFIVKGFKFDQTEIKHPSLQNDADKLLNEMENIDKVTNNTSLATFLNGAAKPLLMSLINDIDSINVGTVTVAPADVNGFDITIPYTGNINSDFGNGNLTLNDFKIIIQPMRSSDYRQKLGQIPDLDTYTEPLTLKPVLLENQWAILSAIDNKENININFNTFNVEYDENNFYQLNILIPFTSKNGFVLMDGISSPIIMSIDISPGF